MKNLKRVAARFSAGASIAALALAPVTAFAQDADEDPAGEGDVAAEAPIVVIGTLIRGTEAVGTQTISVDSEVITQQGANSTNEILALIPQISNTFNGRTEGDPRGAISGGISINRPNLRRLPSFNSASGGVTLVLVDGFRVSPVGVGQAAVDVDIIPAAVLQGVDALTDGGTSLYGADAVAGVLNFRTLRDFDGLKMDANYGFGDTLSGYDQYDASITAGTSWNGGNAYLSFSYAHRDRILNNEVPWASGEVFDADGNGRFVGTQCPSPVGTTNTFVFLPIFGGIWTDNPAAPGAGPTAIGEPCDDFGQSTYVPEQDRYSVYGAVRQELGDNIDLRVTGYFTKRDQQFSTFPRGFTTAAETPVFPANPSAFQTATFDAGTSFSFSPNAAYVNEDFEVGFETWGVTPEVTVGLPADFQVRTTAHFGRSTNYQRRPGVDTVLAQSLVTSGDLDPFDVASASADVITRVTDFETAQDTIHELFVARSVVDGPLFSLPGGDARIAVGGEYQKNKAKSRVLSGAMGAIDSQPYRSASRDSWSVFGELNLPLADFIEVAASVRHDDYSDFGSTTNPNIGVSVTPVEGFKIYGHWNTSFNAPTALDLLGQAVGRFTPPIFSASNPPTDPFGEYNGTGSRAFLLEGANPGLLPQEAESWAIGVELKPTNNLRLGAQFYSIDFTNILGAVDASNENTFTTNADLYYYNPSPELFASFLAQLANGDVLAQQITAGEIALLVDRRTTNLSSAKIEGMDFHAYLDVPASFGDLSFGVNGNIPTRLDLETSGTVNDTLKEAPDFTAALFGTFDSGGFSSRVTVNYTGPVQDNGPDNTGAIFSTGSFVQTNLFLGYKFDDESGPLAGTSFRVIVDNVFEAKPTPVMRSNQNALSYVNFTLGRVFKFGISKRF